ncbi:hypothetical protein [Nonlabens spongiae]|uniref:hypothetical protein n=1 Tax=Nonlabens spongiae TaxID=331648 RepID=UPI0012F4D24B|nr:hypothetical protein [Nonlabens spongiae]
MLKHPAFKNFLKDINAFNLPLCFFLGAIGDISYAIFCFGTLGTVFGLVCYQYLFRAQYNLYRNLGWTRSKLILNLFLMNIVIALSVFILYKLIDIWLS